jgi:hypothetical protein
MFCSIEDFWDSCNINWVSFRNLLIPYFFLVYKVKIILCMDIFKFGVTTDNEDSAFHLATA